MGKPGLFISFSHNVFPERTETGAGVLILLAARLTLKIKGYKNVPQRQKVSIGNQIEVFFETFKKKKKRKKIFQK